LREFEASISPRNFHFPSKDDQYFGIQVKYDEAVKITVERIVQQLQVPQGHYVVRLKDGGDGCGRNAIFQQKDNMNSNSIFSFCFVVLEILKLQEPPPGFDPNQILNSEAPEMDVSETTEGTPDPTPTDLLFDTPPDSPVPPNGSNVCKVCHRPDARHLCSVCLHPCHSLCSFVLDEGADLVYTCLACKGGAMSAQSVLLPVPQEAEIETVSEDEEAAEKNPDFLKTATPVWKEDNPNR
jgi:hypothetical protein